MRGYTIFRISQKMRFNQSKIKKLSLEDSAKSIAAINDESNREKIKLIATL